MSARPEIAYLDQLAGAVQVDLLGQLRRAEHLRGEVVDVGDGLGAECLEGKILCSPFAKVQSHIKNVTSFKKSTIRKLLCNKIFTLHTEMNRKRRRSPYR